MKLVAFNRQRDIRKRRARDTARSHMVQAARQAPDDIDGYVMVYYRKDDDGRMRSRARYFCGDAMDVERLAEYARTEIDWAVRGPGGPPPRREWDDPA